MSQTARVIEREATTRGARGLLRVADLSTEELGRLLDAASDAARAPHRPSRPGTERELLVCLFDGPSTRTRAGFAGAAHRLGLEPLFLTTGDTHIRTGESLEDTLHALSYSAAVTAMRLDSHRSIEEAAAAIPTPVINAGSVDHDPCHVLADVLTLRDHFGRLSGLRIAYVGADRAIPTSLREAADRLGMHVVVAAPPSPTPHPDVYGRMTKPDRIDPRDAVRGAHVVYTDAWVQAGDQARKGGGIWDAATHQVNGELLALAAPDVVVLHRLPLHRGQEIATDVVDGPRSLIWEQVANRLPATVAILEHVLTADDAPGGGSEPISWPAANWRRDSR
jgi:ornithine carbamoyltransferase